MKRLVALSLSGIILISGLMPYTVEASASADEMMNKVIDKMMREKENGNSLYYDLVIEYKDYINKDTLVILYNMLSETDKAKVRNQLGEGTTDKDIMEELENLTSSDIREIKRKIDKVAPSSGGPGSGSSGRIDTDPKEEDEKVEDSFEMEVEEEPKEENPVIKLYFTDISSLWTEAQEAIDFMASRGILKGKAEGLFAPKDPITRAEFAKTIVSLLELKNDENILDKSFTDVDKSQWYYDHVQIAFKHGVIEGRNAETFAPDDLITRQEMAVMISRTIKTMEKLEILPPLQAKEMINTYNDYSDVADWAEGDIALVVKNKIIQGKDGNLLAPKDNATRAEAVVILKRLFDLLNN